MLILHSYSVNHKIIITKRKRRFLLTVKHALFLAWWNFEGKNKFKKTNKLQSLTSGTLNSYKTWTVFLDWRFVVRGFTSSAAGWGGKKISSAMGLRVGQSAAGVTRRGRRRRGCDRQRIVTGNQHWPYDRVCTVTTGWVTLDMIFVFTYLPTFYAIFRFDRGNETRVKFFYFMLCFFCVLIMMGIVCFVIKTIFK